MVGPFVDSVDGLFGDYSPTIMVRPTCIANIVCTPLYSNSTLSLQAKEYQISPRLARIPLMLNLVVTIIAGIILQLYILHVYIAMCFMGCIIFRLRYVYTSMLPLN